MALKGTPSTDPDPMKSQISESAKPPDICTAYLSNNISTTARTMISVTNVVRKARSRSRPTSMPLSKPIRQQAAIVQRNATPTGQPRMFITASAVKLPSAKFEPTERSMPPATMTIIMAITTKPNSPSWRSDTARLAGLKKSGIRYPNKATVMIRKVNGATLSIQRFVKISPST